MQPALQCVGREFLQATTASYLPRVLPTSQAKASRKLRALPTPSGQANCCDCRRVPAILVMDALQSLPFRTKNPTRCAQIKWCVQTRGALEFLPRSKRYFIVHIPMGAVCIHGLQIYRRSLVISTISKARKSTDLCEPSLSLRQSLNPLSRVVVYLLKPRRATGESYIP